MDFFLRIYEYLIITSTIITFITASCCPEVFTFRSPWSVEAQAWPGWRGPGTTLEQSIRLWGGGEPGGPGPSAEPPGGEDTMWGDTRTDSRASRHQEEGQWQCSVLSTNTNSEKSIPCGIWISSGDLASHGWLVQLQIDFITFYVKYQAGVLYVSDQQVKYPFSQYSQFHKQTKIKLWPKVYSYSSITTSLLYANKIYFSSSCLRLWV